MAFEPQPFGKYYLLEKIATGGMAEIFKAKTFGVVGFEKLLAIKRILPHLSQNSEFITMLIDEAKIAVQLNHMNIVQVYDLGKIENDYFIAMEYIHGNDLRTIMRTCLDRDIRISVENAVFVVVEICKGLDYAHRKKDQFGLPSEIVHRDISPQNILISHEGEAKIVDFGIAKAARKATETDAGVLKGKFAYMSPEQARGEEVDQRTDIFSTGIILYELLTGERLFYSENNIQTLEKIKTFEIEPPFLPPDIPSELEYILMQALQNDPEERYQSANDFQVDLTKFLYSSALDFTSKHLAELMVKLFGDVSDKEEKKDDKEGIDLDTETRLMIEHANQEVLVSREEDLTPANMASQMVAYQRKISTPSKSKVPSPAELFEKRNTSGKFRKIFIASGLVVLLLLGFFVRQKIGFGVTGVYQYAVKILKGETPVQPPPINVNQNTSSIYVDTKPVGARIYLDNREMDELSPYLIKNVVPREEHILLIYLQNYKQEKRTIRTDPGETRKIVISLNREMGKLFVDSKPTGADIFIHDKFRGQTPKEFDQIDANIGIPVKLTKKGFQNDFSVIQVQPDQTTIHNVRLKMEGSTLGSIQVLSVPSGAQIVLNGNGLGKVTPNVIQKLEVGKEHQITLQLKGYQDYQQSFRVQETSQKVLKAYLQAIPEEIP